ncbi:FadR/GntR family transcriptional regulator [Acidisoma silvae]|uniref:FadR family transcriptional regulator n=1 Tax=Acidisoma silvae TaxID=2802396 RepID=A0A964E0I9_9PROT|nr:FCD domain-containing protein [Acidisoma silvae]MCB8876768.1 FadR family transcriptional regulator [Acidisoma silvae]
MRRIDVPRSIFRQTLDSFGGAILRGDLPPGALPIEVELAAQFGVGRNLLREVVKALAAKGLIGLRPGMGTWVAPRADWNLLDPDVLRWMAEGDDRLEIAFNLAEFRLIVEPPAAELAALRATAAERDAIMAAAHALDDGLTQPSVIAERDLVFHGAILTAAGNPLLASIGQRLRDMMAAQIRTTTDHAGAFERGLPLHRALARAIAEGAAVQAEALSHSLVMMPYLDLAERLAVAPGQRLKQDQADRAKRPVAAI